MSVIHNLNLLSDKGRQTYPYLSTETLVVVFILFMKYQYLLFEIKYIFTFHFLETALGIKYLVFSM